MDSRKIVGLLGLIAVVGLTAPLAAAEIVPPLAGDADIAHDRDPTGTALIASWRYSHQHVSDMNFNGDRIEILDRRVVWRGAAGHAFLTFRVLGPTGDALAFAAARCPGRARPIEVQSHFSWSPFVSGWITGEYNGATCEEQPRMSERQIAELIDPPPLPVPPKVKAGEVKTPPIGSPERKAILDVLRPKYEALFGKPIQFKVATMTLAAGFAFVVVHPQRADGKPIDKAAWDKAITACEMDREDISNEYWMKRVDGAWTIAMENGLCADDTISMSGATVGAPPQIVGRDKWGSD